MQIKVTHQEGDAHVEVIDPTDGNVFQKAVVGEGEQFFVVAKTATSPADIEVYGPEGIGGSGPPEAATDAPGEQPEGDPPAPTDPPVDPPADPAPADPPVDPPADPAPTDPPADGSTPPADGETPTDPPTEGEQPTEGEGAPADGGTTEGGETPTTSAASPKPLYRVFGSEVPEGFVASGLETPDGFALFTYEGDTAGEPHTAEVGDKVGVGLYAEADDDEQPVQPVATTEGGEQATA